MVAAIQVAGSFMAVLSFGLVLEMPRKYLGWSGLTGGVCWLVYLLVKAGSGSMILGAFLASLSVALMGHLFARIFRAPVSVFLVPGILPWCPVHPSITACIMLSATAGKNPCIIWWKPFRLRAPLPWPCF